jgi:nucleotide-binding universal stress UspA family protein
MRIFIPLDGSETAEYALGPSAQLARSGDSAARLILLRVVPQIADRDAKESAVVASNTAMAESESYLREMTLRPSLVGIPVEWHVCVAQGSVAETISREAKAHHADLIVLARHKHDDSLLSSLLSVAQTVARSTAIPTLIFNVEDTVHSLVALPRPFTILLPLDGSLLAEKSIIPAIKLARGLRGKLVLLMVLPDDEPDPHIAELVLEGAENYLQAQQHKIEQCGVTAEYGITFGTPAERISAMAACWQVNAIAMATHGRIGMARLLGGSVAEEVLAQTHQPLLLIHSQAAMVPAS